MDYDLFIKKIVITLERDFDYWAVCSNYANHINVIDFDLTYRVSRQRLKGLLRQGQPHYEIYSGWFPGSPLDKVEGALNESLLYKKN